MARLSVVVQMSPCIAGRGFLHELEGSAQLSPLARARRLLFGARRVGEEISFFSQQTLWSHSFGRISNWRWQLAESSLLPTREDGRPVFEAGAAGDARCSFSIASLDPISLRAKERARWNLVASRGAGGRLLGFQNRRRRLNELRSRFDVARGFCLFALLLSSLSDSRALKSYKLCLLRSGRTSWRFDAGGRAEPRSLLAIAAPDILTS